MSPQVPVAAAEAVFEPQSLVNDDVIPRYDDLSFVEDQPLSESSEFMEGPISVAAQNLARLTPEVRPGEVSRRRWTSDCAKCRPPQRRPRKPWQR